MIRDVLDAFFERNRLFCETLPPASLEKRACCCPLVGVAVVFDDDDDKDEDSELDEVQSGEEDEDEGEEMGVDARKGRSLRGEEGEEEGEEEDVDELSVQDVDAHWLQRWAGARAG